MTRSNPQEQLVDLHPDLNRLEREQRREARALRDRERQTHLRRLDLEEVLLAENVMENHGQDNVPPAGNGGNARPIGAFDEPNTREVQLGIIPPPIPINNFELKSSMLNLVERSTFKGHSVECPLEHLDRFERLSNRGLKVNGVPEDTMKMILFPFSLEDKAAYWERTVPSHKVSTWADVKTEFLKQFFPKQKTARFRIEIQSFKQKGDETLSEAWERLKGFTRSCPHHGVSKDNLLGIFYRGVHNGIRRSLDTASNGNFASLTCDQAETLIDNLAQSEACYGGDYDRSSIAVVGSSMSDGKLKELDEKIDKLARVLGTGQRNISYVNDYNQGASQETYQEGYNMSNNETSMGQIEDCSYVNNYSKPINQPHPNLSYRSTNVENPQDQVYPPQHQPFNPRPQGINFNPSPQGYSYQGQGTQPNRPSFPPQQGNFSRGNNFQQSGNFQGNFPQAQGGSSHDSETKAMLKQIMDGLAKVQYNQAEFQKETQRRLDVMQTEIERVKCQNAQASSSKPTTSFPSKPETNPKAQCNMITLRSGKELHSPQEVIEEVSEPKETSKEEMKELVEIAKPKENFLDGINDKAKKVLFEPPSYEPPLPFPSRLKNQMIEEQRQRFIEIMDTVMVTLPLKEAIDNSPTWTKFFKSMLTKKKEMERSLKHGIESKKDALQIDSSPTVKTLVKQAHPGRFIIPCSLGSFQIDDALCDSGAFVNVISSEMVEELGIKGMKPHLTSLTFGDASSKCPKGIIEDYPLKVGACIVPTDFVVLDMVGSKKRPLILGAPFLTTVGANIDYVKKVVVLKNVDEKVHYAIEPPLGFCGTITNEEATIEQKEPDRVEVAPSLVEDVLEVDKRLVDQSKDVMVEHMGNLEKKSQDVVSVVKKAKLKKKKLEKAQGVPHEPHHSSLTFEALRIIDGKLECKVKARGGGTKPFGKVRIILEPGKTEIDSGIVNKSMVNAFNMKLKDRGPPMQDGSLPSSSI